jgi:hypothetical protein
MRRARPMPACGTSPSPPISLEVSGGGGGGGVSAVPRLSACCAVQDLSVARLGASFGWVPGFLELRPLTQRCAKSCTNQRPGRWCKGSKRRRAKGLRARHGEARRGAARTDDDDPLAQLVGAEARQLADGGGLADAWGGEAGLRFRRAVGGQPKGFQRAAPPRPPRRLRTTRATAAARHHRPS